MPAVARLEQRVTSVGRPSIGRDVGRDARADDPRGDRGERLGERGARRLDPRRLGRPRGVGGRERHQVARPDERHTRRRLAAELGRRGATCTRRCSAPGTIHPDGPPRPVADQGLASYRRTTATRTLTFPPVSSSTADARGCPSHRSRQRVRSGPVRRDAVQHDRGAGGGDTEHCVRVVPRRSCRRRRGDRTGHAEGEPRASRPRARARPGRRRRAPRPRPPASRRARPCRGARPAAGPTRAMLFPHPCRSRSRRPARRHGVPREHEASARQRRYSASRSRAPRLQRGRGRRAAARSRG